MEHSLRGLKIGFLIAVMLLSSGYRYRCYWMCTDQTAIQNDYTEQRDTCRSYAEAKVDFTLKNQSKAGETKSRNSQLVALFSECMAQHGWTVPDGKDKNDKGDKAAAAAAAPAATPVTSGVAASAAGSPAGPAVAPAAVAAAQDKAYLSRSAECNFARSNAAVSSIANARAQACDMECKQRLQNAPDAPKPAACPTEFKRTLVKGVDRE